MLVRGRMLDDTGAALSERIVQVSVTPVTPAEARAQRLEVRTDREGEFSTLLDLPNARYQVAASFAGEPLQADGSETQTFDLTKAAVQLTFVRPSDARIDLGLGSVEVVVHARARTGGQALALELSEGGRVLATGASGPDGAFRASVPASAWGAPGRGRLFASTPGDATRAPARASIELLRFAQSRVSLQAERDAQRGLLVLSGLLSALGKPLSGKAVGLFDGSQHLASVLTDRTGRFRHGAVPLPSLGSERRALNLQARHESNAPWLGSSRSALVRLELEAGKPPDPWSLTAVLGTCALALWLLARRERSRRPAPAASWGAGVHVAKERTRVLRSLRDVGGEVRDAQTQRPIAGAELVLTRASEAAELALSADADGRFEWRALSEGRWRLRVTAAGYRAVQTEVLVPHRGEWSTLHVGLQSLRTLARLAYRPAAVRRLRSPSWFEHLTPRETLESALREGRAEAAFVELTQLVERALYAKPPPSEDDVAAIEAATRAASPHLPPKPSR